MRTSSLPSATCVSARFTSVVAMPSSSLPRMLVVYRSSNRCSRPRLERFELVLELLDVLEIAIDRGEPHVGDQVEVAQDPQRLLADRRRLDLVADPVSELGLDPHRRLLDLGERHGSLDARPHEARQELLAVERLARAVALDHVQRGVLDPLERRHPLPAEQALAAAANGALAGHAAVDDLRLAMFAVRAVHAASLNI